MNGNEPVDVLVDFELKWSKPTRIFPDDVVHVRLSTTAIRSSSNGFAEAIRKVSPGQCIQGFQRISFIPSNFTLDKVKELLPIGKSDEVDIDIDLIMPFETDPKNEGWSLWK